MSTPTKPKSRLGRGLSSLMSMADLPVETTIENTIPQPLPSTPPTPPTSPTEIPVADIYPNPHQPRRTFNEASIQSLAASLKSTGLIQPIVVRKIGENAYQLIAGERRLRAAIAAKLPTIPALLRDVDPFKQAQMALVENTQREDLNPIDRAQAYKSLMDQLGLTQAELATRLGEDRSSIANFLRLLDLAEPVREFLLSNQLSMGHAKLLAGIQDPARQTALAKTAVDQDLSVRNLERLLAGPAPTPQTSASPEPTPHIKDLEQSITSQLGLRVQLKQGGKSKGKLVIHYGDLDQFDQLIARLGIKLNQ